MIHFCRLKRKGWRIARRMSPSGHVVQITGVQPILFQSVVVQFYLTQAIVFMHKEYLIKISIETILNLRVILEQFNQL